MRHKGAERARKFKWLWAVAMIAMILALRRRRVMIFWIGTCFFWGGRQFPFKNSDCLYS